MNENNYKLLEILGEMDESYVTKAGEPWKRKTGRRRITGSGFKAACAALVIGAGLLGAVHPQVNAAVRELFSRIGQMAGQEEAYAPYADQMELAQTKEDVTLTLQEIVAADNQLYAAVSMDTDLKQAEIGDFRIRFDKSGEEVDTSYSAGFFPESSKENGYVLKFSFENDVLTEDTDVTLDIWVRKTQEEDSEKIPFAFTFSPSGSSLNQDTAKLALDHSIEVGPGVVMKLESFSQNSIFSRIRVKCGEHDGSLPQPAMYYLRGTDSLGNEVQYTYEPENGPYGHFTTDETADASMPSPDCEWIELRLYMLDLKSAENEGADIQAIGEPFRIELSDLR